MNQSSYYAYYQQVGLPGRLRLIETAKANGLIPFDYIKHLLDERNWQIRNNVAASHTHFLVEIKQLYANPLILNRDYLST